MLFIILLSSFASAQDSILKEDFEVSYKLILSGVDVGIADVTFKKTRTGFQLTNKLIFKENQSQVTITGTTTFDKDKNLVRFQKTSNAGSGRKVTRVDFSGNQAALQGDETEVSLSIPGKRVLLDNYSIADLLVLADGLTPTMEREEGKLLITSRMMLVDYEVESAGPGRYTLNGEVIQCDLYKLKIAGRIEAVFYKQGNTLIAFQQKPDYTAFEIAR